MTFVQSRGVLGFATRRHVVAVGILIAVVTAIRCWPPVVIYPDGEGYILLGENFAWNGCFSDSPPATAACNPTWGDHPPGYPLLIAFVRLLLPSSDRSIAVVQTILFAIAAAYFAKWIVALKGGAIEFYAYLLVALFSPAAFGSSRVILTELLAAATTLWVFAEILRSVISARPRILQRR